MAESYLIQKLESVEQTFNELTRRMADPDVAKDPGEFQKIAKMRASLEETVQTYHQWKQTEEELQGAREIYKEASSDPEMKEMAGLEVAELESSIEDLEQRLKILLLPRDPNDDKNIMLEIRAGTPAIASLAPHHAEARIPMGSSLCRKSGLACAFAQ